MEHVLLAFMLFFSPAAPPSELKPYAEYITAASQDPDVLAELFVHGRYEGRWGQAGVPMGVTAWRNNHHRRPDPHEAVCAALEAHNNATRDCGSGSTNRLRRVSYYITGNCTVIPDAASRGRSIIAMRRVFNALLEGGVLPPQEPLTCPAGE